MTGKWEGIDRTMKGNPTGEVKKNNIKFQNAPEREERGRTIFVWARKSYAICVPRQNARKWREMNRTWKEMSSQNRISAPG